MYSIYGFFGIVVYSFVLGYGFCGYVYIGILYKLIYYISLMILYSYKCGNIYRKS